MSIEILPNFIKNGKHLTRRRMKRKTKDNPHPLKKTQIHNPRQQK
jgi:hypothetical protein